MRNKVFQQELKIISNTKISQGYFKIIIKSSKIANLSQPGQFVEIRVSCGYEPFLRRPFSIHRCRGSNIEILCEVVGKGTAILSQRKAGDYLDIIGPLGKGFDYELGITNYQLPILIAGGMGVAPLVFLAEKLAYSVERIAYRKDKGFQLSAKRYPLNAIVLIGAKTKNQILCEEEFRNLGCNVKISTDDGSKGFKGKVTDLLRKILPKNRRTKELKNFIYACGPKPMLQEISSLSKQYNIPAQVSLEEHMACGIGACLGCIVKTKDGFKRVCKEGPVFNVDEIIW